MFCHSKIRLRSLFFLFMVMLALPAMSAAGPLDGSAYQKLIGEIFAEFSPEISRHSASTEIIFHEKSSGTGAFTWRKNGGRVWEFHFYDGVLKIKNVSADVLALIVCHELGHHLAGYPFNENTNWSAAEGQADYFSTHACAPRIWSRDDSLNSTFSNRIPVAFKERCDSAFSEQPRRNICYRTVFAMDAMRNYEGHGAKVLPSLTKPEPSIVKATETRHPAAQCRVDTQLAGTFCSRDFDFSTVPGHLGMARNTLAAERDSSPSHCDEGEFPLYMKRPRCWFSSLEIAQ